MNTDQKPFGVDHIRAVCPNPVLPPRIKLESLEWGWRLCSIDFQSSHDYRWPFPGRWAKAAGPFTNGQPCPQKVGDGLCVARTISGATSGGARFGYSVGLLVAYLEKDVLGSDSDKVRVKRAWVADVFTPARALTPGSNLSYWDLSYSDLRCSNLSGSDLRGSNLSYSDLSYSDLSYSDLRCSNLSGSDLRGSHLSGSDLSGSDLRGALYAQGTLWPIGFDPKASGAVKR